MIDLWILFATEFKDFAKCNVGKRRYGERF